MQSPTAQTDTGTISSLSDISPKLPPSRVFLQNDPAGGQNVRTTAFHEYDFHIAVFPDFYGDIMRGILSAGSEMSMSQKQVNEKEPPAMDNEDNFESFDAFFAKTEPKKISTDDEGSKNIDDFLKK